MFVVHQSTDQRLDQRTTFLGNIICAESNVIIANALAERKCEIYCPLAPFDLRCESAGRHAVERSLKAKLSIIFSNQFDLYHLIQIVDCNSMLAISWQV